MRRVVLFAGLALTITMLGAAGGIPGPPLETTPPFVATDPGLRVADPTDGQPLANLSAVDLAQFAEGRAQFLEEQTVTGTEAGRFGLGPRFNGIGCFSCHSQPKIGGSAPQINPQIEMGLRNGAQNTIPLFLTPTGPIREARFKSDGGVHGLFTIRGRADAPGCFIVQPDFALAAAQQNLVFRIPTPVFGAGLMAAIDDATILANMNLQNAGPFGVHGHPNRNGNDGTISRFGWKAQNKSLTLFAGEASNVEIGVTNELFPNERDETAGCQLNPTPESNTVAGAVSDATLFATFMTFLEQPAQVKTDSSRLGRVIFKDIGCEACHVANLRTGNNVNPALNNIAAVMWSDLVLHGMGPGLADDIIQGEAQGDEFRTSPLWGLGQRIFFLHDGRTSDVREAIELHAAVGGLPTRRENHGPGSPAHGQYRPSEASVVIQNWLVLDEISKQHVLDFMRSL